MELLIEKGPWNCNTCAFPCDETEEATKKNGKATKKGRFWNILDLLEDFSLTFWSSRRAVLFLSTWTLRGHYSTSFFHFLEFKDHYYHFECKLWKKRHERPYTSDQHSVLLCSSEHFPLTALTSLKKICLTSHCTELQTCKYNRSVWNA